MLQDNYIPEDLLTPQEFRDLTSREKAEPGDYHARLKDIKFFAPDEVGGKPGITQITFELLSGPSGVIPGGAKAVLKETYRDHFLDKSEKSIQQETRARRMKMELLKATGFSPVGPFDTNKELISAVSRNAEVMLRVTHRPSASDPTVIYQNVGTFRPVIG